MSEGSTPEVAIATVQARLVFTPYLTVTNKKHQEIDLGWTKIPHWPGVIWKIGLGVLFHTLYLTITNSQLHKKRVLIVIHFNPSRSFFYTRGRQPFPSRGPKINSARYGGPYQFSTNNYGLFSVYGVKTWDMMEFQSDLPLILQFITKTQNTTYSTCLELKQKYCSNIIAYENDGNCPNSQIFGALQNRGPRLKPF